jgi:DNA-binding CsgD family transcriptional regulator
MSRSSAADAASVLELAAELSQVPSPRLPDDVMARLPALVPGELVVLNSVLSSDEATVQHPTTGAPGTDPSARLTEVLAEHPVVAHYLSTRDPRPCRVSDLVTQQQWRSSRAYSLLARPHGVDHVLTIPVSMGATGGLAYTISRSGSDFSDRDRDVAALLQPALAVLHQPRHGPAAEPTAARSPGRGVLTVRELEVLELLAEGRTAQRIATDLHLSPRTVRKHLEHVYTKLGVGDRLSAVNAGRARGWLR